MLPEVVKYRVWNLALRMNPQICTYKARSIATDPSGSDSFTSYMLARVVYRPLDKQEQASAAATLSDVTKVWTITMVDLENAIPLSPQEQAAPAPPPQIGYELSFADGTTWVVRSVNIVAIGQAFECLCAQARPQ